MQILKNLINKIVNNPMPPLLSFLAPGTIKCQEELEIKSTTRTKDRRLFYVPTARC